MVHDRFIALPRAIRRYRGDAPLQSFLIGIAVNHARRHIRAAARRRRATEKLAADRELAPNVALDASEMLERKRLADSLSAALDELPIDQRVAFVLCEAEGRTSIEAGGRTDVEAAIDSDAIGTVMLRHGGRHWHNVYGVGGQRVDTASGMPNNDLWMLGLGVGPSFHIAGLPADLDAIAWHVNHGSAFEDRLSLLAQARLTIAVPIGAGALIAGGAINTYVSTDHDSPLAIARTSTDSMTSDVRVHIWPSAFVGVRL